MWLSFRQYGDALIVNFNFQLVHSWLLIADIFSERHVMRHQCTTCVVHLQFHQTTQLHQGVTYLRKLLLILLRDVFHAFNTLNLLTVATRYIVFCLLVHRV